MPHIKTNIYMRIFVIVAGGLLLTALPLSAGTTTIPFDSRQTYLLTYDDPGALDAIPVSLASIGLSSGMTIDLQATGTFCYHWNGSMCPNAFGIPSVAGVFSSTSQLGPSNMLNRVTGAIASNGPPIVTLPTNNGNIPTDIPQDFSISSIGEYPDGPFTLVNIPNGANYLFVSVNDSYYGDNYSTDLALHIMPVPEPGTLFLFAVAGPVVAGLRRKVIGASE
jgi:hypothetical protein